MDFIRTKESLNILYIFLALIKDWISMSVVLMLNLLVSITIKLTHEILVKTKQF